MICLYDGFKTRNPSQAHTNLREIHKTSTLASLPHLERGRIHDEFTRAQEGSQSGGRVLGAAYTVRHIGQSPLKLRQITGHGNRQGDADPAGIRTVFGLSSHTPLLSFKLGRSFQGSVSCREHGGKGRCKTCGRVRKEIRIGVLARRFISFLARPKSLPREKNW